MKVAVAAEVDAGEPRVAATPETIKKMIGLGAEVAVEPGAGVKSGILDADYAAAGATVTKDAVNGADIVLKVRRPQASETSRYKKGAIVIAIMDPYGHEDALRALAEAGLVAFAMELLPRITRAQAMDVLSSQANLAASAAAGVCALWGPLHGRLPANRNARARQRRLHHRNQRIGRHKRLLQNAVRAHALRFLLIQRVKRAYQQNHGNMLKS